MGGPVCRTQVNSLVDAGRASSPATGATGSTPLRLAGTRHWRCTGCTLHCTALHILPYQGRPAWPSRPGKSGRPSGTGTEATGGRGVRGCGRQDGMLLAGQSGQAVPICQPHACQVRQCGGKRAAVGCFPDLAARLWERPSKCHLSADVPGISGHPPLLSHARHRRPQGTAQPPHVRYETLVGPAFAASLTQQAQG